MLPVDRFAAIGLDELGEHARLQRRHERKYVVDIDVLARLLDRLAASHRVLEVGGVRVQRLRTTYLDTPDRALYRAHVQGRRWRFKCRHRRYLATGDGGWELKLKGPRGRTEKHVLPSAQPVLDASARRFLRDRLHQACGLELPDRLERALVVEAERLTLASPELGERVTCDLSVVAGGHGLAPRLAIVESKAGGRDATGDRILRALGARPASGCSKYCIGIALDGEGLPRSPMLPVLRRAFVPVGDAAGAVAVAA